MTGVGTYEPDWRGWLLMDKVEDEDAVLLTLGVDPAKRADWRKHASAAELAEFDRRSYWVKKWPLRLLNAGTGFLGLSYFFYLPEVVHFAKKAGWQLPEPLVKLIETERNDREKTPIKTSNEEKEPNPRQIAERPINISNTAWRRFCQAREFDPDFSKQRGGISKAARHIARSERVDAESVRRHLNRVLKAQRDQSEQK